jgi:predicted nucleic acid-binding protein
MGTRGLIVVDTNIVAYLLLKGARTAQAEAVRARNAQWRVPALFPHEWINVLTAHVRANLLDRDTAARTYRRGMSMVQIDAQPVDAITILNLHLLTGRSSYDCEFIELAERLGVPLVTVDGEILSSSLDFVFHPDAFLSRR